MYIKWANILWEYIIVLYTENTIYMSDIIIIIIN